MAESAETIPESEILVLLAIDWVFFFFYSEHIKKNAQVYVHGYHHQAVKQK